VSATRRRLRVYSDPFQHALIAAAVAAPLVPRAGAPAVATAVAAGLVIDIDHALAARSLRVRSLTGLATRPRSHSLVTALGAGAVATAAGGPLLGWAAFAGLASHLLHDAGDRAAPTPLLWPFAPARQIGRRRQVAGTLALIAASGAVSRAAGPASPARAAGGARDGSAGSGPRTASARS
jgi:hypothetical protein